MKITYLAIPYTFNADLSFDIANKVSAELMSQGEVVFSPISHSHHVADHLPDSFRFSQSFWLAQDLPILRLCSEVKVVVIGTNGHNLIKESKGCQSEIAEAIKLNIPITYINFKL